MLVEVLKSICIRLPKAVKIALGISGVVVVLLSLPLLPPPPLSLLHSTLSTEVNL